MLSFYGPVNLMGSCQAWSVYLTTHLLGRPSPLSSLPVLCTFFRQKLTTALLESAKGTEWSQKILYDQHRNVFISSMSMDSKPLTSCICYCNSTGWKQSHKNSFFCVSLLIMDNHVAYMIGLVQYCVGILMRQYCSDLAHYRTDSLQ